MLVINNELRVRSRHDIIAIQSSSYAITIYLESGALFHVSSDEPVKDANLLMAHAFVESAHEDPNEVHHFHTTRNN